MVPLTLVARCLLGGTLAVIAGLAAFAEPLAPLARLEVSAAASTSASPGLRPRARALAGILAPVVPGTGATVRPPPRPVFTAAARWDGADRGQAWSVAVMRAIEAAPLDLRDVVPADIAAWCPGYVRNPPHLRAAFWAGTVSALARHESGFRAGAVGGGGAWHGLMQIAPATARHYGCEATSGEALRDGEANLACAVRIMSRTVARDGVVAAGRRGIAADWGPMTQEDAREEMRAWVRGQHYCEVMTAVTTALRPVARAPVPVVLAAVR